MFTLKMNILFNNPYPSIDDLSVPTIYSVQGLTFIIRNKDLISSSELSSMKSVDGKKENDDCIPSLDMSKIWMVCFSI